MTKVRKETRKKMVETAVAKGHELMAKQLEKTVIEALTMLPEPERARFGQRVQDRLEAARVKAGTREESLAMASILANLAEHEMGQFLAGPASREQMLEVAEKEPLYAFYGCIYTHSVLWLKTQVASL